MKCQGAGPMVPREGCPRPASTLVKFADGTHAYMCMTCALRIQQEAAAMHAPINTVPPPKGRPS